MPRAVCTILIDLGPSDCPLGRDASDRLHYSNRFGPAIMPIWEGCLERFVDFHVPAYHFERTPRAKSSILIDFNDSIRIFTSKAAYGNRDLSLCFVKLPKSTFSYDLYVFLRSLRTVILHVKTRMKNTEGISDCRPLISPLLLHKKQLPPPLKRCTG